MNRKFEIKEYLVKLYNLPVSHVHTTIYNGKTKARLHAHCMCTHTPHTRELPTRVSVQLNMQYGVRYKEADYKKAYVYLHDRLGAHKCARLWGMDLCCFAVLWTVRPCFCARVNALMRACVLRAICRCRPRYHRIEYLNTPEARDAWPAKPHLALPKQLPKVQDRESHPQLNPLPGRDRHANRQKNLPRSRDSPVASSLINPKGPKEY